MGCEIQQVSASSKTADQSSKATSLENVRAEVSRVLQHRRFERSIQRQIETLWLSGDQTSCPPINPLLVRLGLTQHIVPEQQSGSNHAEHDLDPTVTSLFMQMTPLWCSDIDGTLFRHRKDGLHPDVAAMAAYWMSLGGAFHVLSAGSAAGLARDDLDLVQRIGEELQRLSLVKDPSLTIKELMRFQMSNGAAVYSVANPSVKLGRGQLRFEMAASSWINEDDAAALHALFVANGFQVLAMDADEIKGNQRGVTVFFLKHPAAMDKKVANELEAQINMTLEKEMAPARALWLGGQRGRFDAFPLVDGEMVTKDKIFLSESANYRSVVFTGDRCVETYPDGSRGSDYPIVALEKRISHLQAAPVDGPVEVCRVLMPHLMTLIKSTIGRQAFREYVNSQERLADLLQKYSDTDLISNQ